MRADSLVWAACAAAVGVVVPLCGCRSTARATNACGQLGVGGLRRRCRCGSAAVGVLQHNDADSGGAGRRAAKLSARAE